MPHICPKRPYDPHGVFVLPEEDDFSRRDSCSFCGSLNPATFMYVLETGEATLVPTDKDYKTYVIHSDIERAKFYFDHLTTAQRIRFVELLNEKRFKIDFPGNFYVLPFFIGS